jgi:hypothetical protein
MAVRSLLQPLFFRLGLKSKTVYPTLNEWSRQQQQVHLGQTRRRERERESCVRTDRLMDIAVSRRFKRTMSIAFYCLLVLSIETPLHYSVRVAASFIGGFSF